MAAFTMREDCWYFKEAVWDFSVIYFGEGMLLLTAQLEADMDFYGEYGFWEASERTECHADDCCIFLCEDSF